MNITNIKNRYFKLNRMLLLVVMALSEIKTCSIYCFLDILTTFIIFQVISVISMFFITLIYIFIYLYVSYIYILIAYI